MNFRTYVRIPINMFPVITTTELTRCSLIFLAARVTRSEGNTTGTLQNEKQKFQSEQIVTSYVFLVVADIPAIFSYDS